MDIASVYLNLASLLGTEIEVEGYHLWGALYSGEREHESLRLALPRYVNQQGMTSVNHALNGTDHWTKITVRGYLTQNRRGEPFLDPIFSIRYKTQHVDYKAALTYEGQNITCAMQGDLTANHPYDAADYHPFEKTFFTSRQVSKAVLLEAILMPPPHRGNQNFSVLIRDQVSSRSDLVRQILNRSAFFLIGVPVVVALNWRGNVRAALSMIFGGKHQFESHIWFHDRDTKFLNQFFDFLIPKGYSHWHNNGVQFLFAGQLVWIDKEEKKAYKLPRQYQLKFASLDYLQVSKTITLQRSQDE